MEPHHHRQLYAGSHFGPPSSRFHVHLDATAGREVVFCHGCTAEWYRDEHGLVCPECHNDATEIVEPENDPRDVEPEDEMPMPFGTARSRFQEDMEEHPSPPEESIWDGSNPPRHRPIHETDVFSQFHNLIQNLTRTPAGHYAPPGAPAAEDGPQEGQRITTTFWSRGPFQVTRTEVRGAPHHATGMIMGPDLFRAFADDMGPPREGPVIPDGRPPGRVRIGESLADIIGMFINPTGRHGDIVHSQEALDRIITQLMEANPQSNAAPPTSESVLRRLPRKTVDDGMLEAEGGEAECTICIDNIARGETVLVLPCKHWFHDSCVTLWLKEHNTCPICRTTVEIKDDATPTNPPTPGGAPNPGADNNNNNNNAPRSSGSNFDASFHFPGHYGPIFAPPAPPDERRGSTRPSHGHAPISPIPPTPPNVEPPTSRRRIATDPISIGASSIEDLHPPRYSRHDSSGSSSVRSAYASMGRSVNFRSSRRHSHSPTSPDPSQPTRTRSPHHSASSSRDRTESHLSFHPRNWLRSARPSGNGNGGNGGHDVRDGGRRY